MLSGLFGINIFLFTIYNSTKTRFQYNCPLIMGIYGCLGCGEAADHTITKNSGLLYPFFFATHMVLFDTFLYYVYYLSVLVRRTTGLNMSKLWSLGPKSERFTFLSINILQMCLISVMIILNSLQNKRWKRLFFVSFINKMYSCFYLS